MPENPQGGSALWVHGGYDGANFLQARNRPSFHTKLIGSLYGIFTIMHLHLGNFFYGKC